MGPPPKCASVGRGGDPEHSRRKGRRIKRLPFLSRAEGSPTWSGLRDLNPRSLGPKPSAIPNFAKPGTVLSIIYIFSKNATQICSEGKDAFVVEGRDAFAVDGKDVWCCKGRETRCGRQACVRKAGRGAQGRAVGCRADAGRVDRLGRRWSGADAVVVF